MQNADAIGIDQMSGRPSSNKSKGLQFAHMYTRERTHIKFNQREFMKFNLCWSSIQLFS